MRAGDTDTEGKEPDIWAGIAAKPISAINTQAGLVGLHNLVLTLPKLKLMQGKLMDRSGLAKGGGGLKMAGELNEARQGVVEGYGPLMRERREGMG